MLSFALILLVLSSLLALGWLYQAVAALRGMPSLPDLTLLNSSPLEPSSTPHLTVIVPACNEAQSIAACLNSLLQSTGIALEILAVNDRSTDATAAEMRSVLALAATTPHTLRILTVESLPENWLGKPHAMALAASQASAPWLLFTDGDVLFDPTALARALSHARQNSTDHLVLIPTLLVERFTERALQAALQVMAQWSVRLWRVRDPRAKDFIGVGGFNLIRREAYLAVGGYQALRMEVLDDMRMGWALKRAGFRAEVVLGPQLVRIRWIVGARSVIHLVEKNGFATFRFQPIVHLLASLGFLLHAVVPPAAFLLALLLELTLPLSASLPHQQTLAVALFASSIATYLFLFVTYWANRRLTLASTWLVLFFGPCTLLVFYAFLRSMVLALARGGIVWRGTRYSLAELRLHAGKW